MKRISSPGRLRAGLEAMLCPRSIAIVGASASPDKLSGQPLHFLRRHSYPGSLYPINRRVQAIDGIPTYPSLRDVPGPVDLALVLLPAEQVLQSIEECIAAGVRAAVIFAAGFAEAGAAGQRLQADLRNRTTDRITLLGPNSQGFVSVHGHVAASFSQILRAESLLAGGLAMASQSGAICGSVMDIGRAHEVGMSCWISTGNQVDLDVVQCAQHLLGQAETEVLAMYLEGAPEAESYRALLDDARRVGKPVLVLHSGRSAASVRSVVSHTGALAGNAAVFEDVSRHHGAILVNDPEELVACASSLIGARGRGGRRVAVVAGSGGAGAILADQLNEQSLELPTLEPATKAALRRSLPAEASVENPVDVTATFMNWWTSGRSGIWSDCLATVAADPQVDQVMAAITLVPGETGVRLADELIQAARVLDKPLLVGWMGGALCAPGFMRLRQAKVPVSNSLVSLARSAAAIAVRDSRSGPLLQLRAASPRLTNLVAGLGSEPRTLTEWQSRPLLNAAGIRVPRGRLCRSRIEAADAATRLGHIVVLKVQSAGIPHKARVGAVQICGSEEASAAYEAILKSVGKSAPDAVIDGVLVQEYVRANVEALFGITLDPQFGHVLAVGRGGQDVESTKLRFLDLPLYEEDCPALLEGLIRAAPSSAERRQRRAALEWVLHGLLQLEVALKDRLLDIEMNPVAIVTGGRQVFALDCLIRLGPKDAGAASLGT